MFTYRAKVLRVVDADTIDVEVDLGFSIFSRQRLRLARIDAPEVRGEERPEGLKAKAFVEGLISDVGGVVVITTTKEVGKYGRYIAEFLIPRPDGDTDNLSDLLLEKGLAEVYG